MGIYSPKGGNPVFSRKNTNVGFSSRGGKSASERRRLILEGSGGGCTDVEGELFHLDTDIANSYCNGSIMTLNGTASLETTPVASGNKAFESGNIQTGFIGTGTGQGVNYAGVASGVMAGVSEPFTMEWWYYGLAKSGVNDQTIMGTEVSTPSTPVNGDLVIQRTTSDSVAIFFYDVGWKAIGGGFNLQNSVWHHVAFMRGTDNIPVVYVDGSAAQWSSTVSGALGVADEEFKIGGGNHTNNVDFEGHTADWRFTKGKRLYGGDTVAGQTTYTLPSTLLSDADPKI